MTTEDKPAEVPEGAKQAGNIQSRWSWVEPSVWTSRMLTALENGVKGGVWFSLIDKVASKRNLMAATQQVVANKGSAGVDRVSVERFLERAGAEIEELHRGLRDRTYRPQAIRRHFIPKLGSKELRPLGIPTVRDRVVQTALRNVLEPIFERTFAAQSYGFRPGRGCKDALRRVDQLLTEGNTWVVDADLKSYFDTIPHARLMARVGERVADGRVLELIESFLNQPILEELKEWTPTEGTPQGAVVSPLLANAYLNPLDHAMEQRGYNMVRYADDFVVLCHSEEEAKRALEEIQRWTAEAGLKLHPTKTRLVDLEQPGGFDFLGYHFEQYGQDGGKKWPRQKSQYQLRERLRGKTARNRPGSIEKIVAEVNRTLRGWYGYFKWSQPTAMQRVDEWTRERIRHIVRRRHKRRGMVKARERNEYNVAWFAERGFFSLWSAQARWLQSLAGNH